MSHCIKCDTLLYGIHERDYDILTINEKYTAKKLSICPICFSLLDRKTKILTAVKHLCNTIRKVKRHD